MWTWSLFAASQDDFQGYQETKNRQYKRPYWQQYHSLHQCAGSRGHTAQKASVSDSVFVEQSIGSFTSASSESSYLSDFSEGCDAVMEATTQGSSSCDGRKKT